MRQKILIAGKVYLILIGAFIVLMSIDVFEMDGTTLELIGGFLISISPGVVLIILVWLFWKKELYLGIITLVINTAFLVIFKFLVDIPENLPMIFIMTVPLYVFGVLFILEDKKKIAK
jgi:hypothetical protein